VGPRDGQLQCILAGVKTQAQKQRRAVSRMPMVFLSKVLQLQCLLEGAEAR
jgi:hypothetical protein